jgi:hypothetical protein
VAVPSSKPATKAENAASSPVFPCAAPGDEVGASPELPPTRFRLLRERDGALEARPDFRCALPGVQLAFEPPELGEVATLAGRFGEVLAFREGVERLAEPPGVGLGFGGRD